MVGKHYFISSNLQVKICSIPNFYYKFRSGYIFKKQLLDVIVKRQNCENRHTLKLWKIHPRQLQENAEILSMKIQDKSDGYIAYDTVPEKQKKCVFVSAHGLKNIKWKVISTDFKNWLHSKGARRGKSFRLHFINRTCFVQCKDFTCMNICILNYY